jgi:hypothetical protein
MSASGTKRTWTNRCLPTIYEYTVKYALTRAR